MFNTIEIPLGLFFMFVLGTLLYMNFKSMKEGFLNGSPATPNASFAPRCGVEFPACPTGMKCINGYCGIPAAPSLPRNTGLPVYPENSGGQWGSETLDKVGGVDTLWPY